MSSVLLSKRKPSETSTIECRNASEQKRETFPHVFSSRWFILFIFIQSYFADKFCFSSCKLIVQRCIEASESQIHKTNSNDTKWVSNRLPWFWCFNTLDIIKTFFVNQVSLQCFDIYQKLLNFFFPYEWIFVMFENFEFIVWIWDIWITLDTWSYKLT